MRKQIAAVLGNTDTVSTEDFNGLYSEGRCRRISKKIAFSVLKIEDVTVGGHRERVALIQTIGVFYSADGIPDTDPHYIAVSQLQSAPTAEQVKKAYSAYLPSIVEYKTTPPEASAPPIVVAPPSEPKPPLDGAPAL